MGRSNIAVPSIYKEVHDLGDVVNFKCVEGMKFEGESLSTTCQVSKICVKSSYLCRVITNGLLYYLELRDIFLVKFCLSD